MPSCEKINEKRRKRERQIDYRRRPRITKNATTAAAATAIGMTIAEIDMPDAPPPPPPECSALALLFFAGAPTSMPLKMIPFSLF
jgi:hypothetical protein